MGPEELTSSCLARVEATEDQLQAWLQVDHDGALKQARDLSSFRQGRLWGIPVAVKDIIDVAGLPTTAASKVLAGNIASTDAPVVDALRRAGAVILGKTNTQEFAYGVVTSPTSNPWDLSRIPGGSSGGSAAAISARQCPAALGTDTAGSIRIPSALCGVSGIKPRPGLVSAEGVIPLSPSFDAVGPIARSAQDLRILLEVMSGGRLERGSGDFEVALVKNEALGELDSEVEKVYLAALDVVRSLATIQYTDTVDFTDLGGPRLLFLMEEALEVHRSNGWWPARADDYRQETRNNLEFSENVKPEDFERAREQLPGFVEKFRTFLDTSQLLITPTVGVPAPAKLGAESREAGRPRSPAVLSLTRIPGPVNAARLAAASIPCGFTSDGLPVGLHVIGDDEALILDFAEAFQRETDWAEREPPLAGTLGDS